MNKRPVRELMDGYVEVFKPFNIASSFSAPIAPKTRDDMESIAVLAFKEMSKRDEDTTWAESVGRSLNLKIKTHICPRVDKNSKCVVGRMMYDVIKVDFNRARDEMFLYLEEVRILEDIAE
jgi:TolB-like protein